MSRPIRASSRAIWPLIIIVFAALPSPSVRGDDNADLARYDAKIKPSDREHWAFQPVRRPAVPSVKNQSWVRNPIDAFILSRLEAEGWTPATDAEPRAWIRRVFFDLTGLPPTPEEVAEFVAESSVEARARWVDKLLDRAAYGERWARHWLDVVRFAESNGYERDATKPSAWRYRDYVIDSLNRDKPYDRFVTEQLAGDELPGACAETQIASGFLRLGPWDDEPADPAQDRFDQLDDIVLTTSETFLGLTLGCARCHNHKFEPLTMHDYYRMVAVFDPLDRPRNGRTELDLPLGGEEAIQQQHARDQRIEELRKRIAELTEPAVADLIKAEKILLPAEVQNAFLTKSKERTDEQRKLVATHSKAVDAALASAVPSGVKNQVDDAEREIRELKEKLPDLPRGYFLRESKSPPKATHLLLRGQASAPGPVVLPGLPAVLVATQPPPPETGGRTSGRRLALARWIASAENPLTARVIVNRVWHYHFGEGLVRTPSDFGVMGDPPTHPELLDWLAAWFTHEGNWSLKNLHRLILSSHTAQMSKRGDPRHADADPDNRLLSHLPYRRLEVEAIRDAMLQSSGRLNDAMRGPSVYPEIPREALEAHSDPNSVWPPFVEPEASRRTIYVFIKRSLLVPMLEVLDFSDTCRSAPRRAVTSVAPQALTLLNGEFVNRQARYLADRVETEATGKPKRQIERLYWLTLSRPPTPSEIERVEEFLRASARDAIVESVGSPHPLDESAARRKAIEHLARVMFNLNEFVYTD